MSALSMKRASRYVTRCTGLSLVLVLASTAFADTSKISPDLQPLLADPSASVNVIVQYNSAPQTCASGGLLGGLLCTTVNLVGGVVNVVFTLINAVAGTMPAGNVIALSNQSNVSYISLDRPLGAMLDYSAAGVNAPVAWSSGWDGTGVGI